MDALAFWLALLGLRLDAAVVAPTWLVVGTAGEVRLKFFRSFDQKAM